MRIVDSNGHKIDLFYLLLLYTGKYSYLPDLYEVAGKDLTFKLLDCFAGTNISFPSKKDIKKHATEVNIYLRIKSASPARRGSLVIDLADEYSVTEDTVRNIYNRVSKIIEDDMNMEIKIGKRC